tara:strand:- start:1017 stop:2243 length:1227 start_codon:yes stop_codon:yes gene_type:complete
MAVRDTRFGGNLERANTGIRSLPQRDPISFADRESYGRGQIYNPQKGARDVSGYMEEEDYFNPNVFSRQMAVQGFPNAPREIANNINFGGPFSSAANLRESLNYMKAIKKNPDLIDPMYRDLYPDMNVSQTNPDLYKTKEEQMEDAGPFEALQMDRYARENPLLNILKGMRTTNVTGPGEYGQYENETTEEMVDPGVYAMSPAELSYMYGASTDAPMTSYPDQLYPDEKYRGLPKYKGPSDRQLGLNNPFMPSDRQPEIDEFNDPRSFTDPNFSLTPENIGMDRAPNEALSEIFGSYQPPIDPTQEYYEDPIMTLGIEDLRKNAQYRMAGDTTSNMAGELMRNGIDTQGLNSDEIMQLYNQIQNPDADVDQFGIAGVDEDNAAVRQMIKKRFTMEQIMKIMAARPVSS